MELSQTGDYEFKYGSPHLTDDTVDGKWVAQEFRGTQIRVGTPWADCDAAVDYSEARCSWLCL